MLREIFEILSLYLNLIIGKQKIWFDGNKWVVKILLVIFWFFEFFDSVFSFTLSFILKRREKLPKNANNTSTSDVAQALILDHFVSIWLVFWSTVYLFQKRSENHRLSADNILILDLKRSLEIFFRFAVKCV